MHTKEDIELFYKDVESLKLKFPVAAISRVTKESKGNVSRILSRKLEPSESFLKRFYDSFKNVPRSTENRNGQNTTENQSLTAPSIFERLILEKEARRQESADRAKRAEQEVDRLFELLTGSLSTLAASSTETNALVRAILSEQTADDMVIMDNQDEQMKHKIGSSSAKSGKLQVKAAQHKQNMDKRADARK